jgi:hypothetical protein
VRLFYWSYSLTVIPAQAGIQVDFGGILKWIPTCLGMMGFESFAIK